MRLAIAAFLVAAAACGPGGRDDVPDAKSGCGDGVITPPEEQCDDGLANGSTESLCTVDCRDRTLTASVEQQVALPVPARKLYWTNSCFQGQWLVASNFDDEGIAVVSTEGPESFLLKAHAAPVDFTIGSIDEMNTCRADLIWVEQAIPGIGGPWLLWTGLGDTPEPVIHELPFPIPGASNVVFEREGRQQWPILLSAEAGGHLYLARLFYPEAPGGYVDLTDLGPSSSTPRLSVNIRESGPGPDFGFSRVAEFGSDGPTSVVMVKYDYTAFSDPPSVDFAGTWPNVVLSADDGEWVPETEGQTQLALLDPSGTVNIWDFHGDPAEVEPLLFGNLTAGTQQIATFDFDGGTGCVTPYCGVVGVAPDGSIELLTDNGTGRALEKQRFDFGVPCTACAIDQNELRAVPEWFAFDTLAVRVRIRADL